MRLVPLRDQDIPVACTLLVEAMEWSPRTILYPNPQGVLGEGVWMSALEGEELIGVCGAHNLDWPSGTAELALGVVPKWRGSGAAKRLAETLHTYSFKDLGLRRLTVHCLEGSPAESIATGCGLNLEGRHTRARLRRGEYLDSLTFALMKEG